MNSPFFTQGPSWSWSYCRWIYNYTTTCAIRAYHH